MPTKRAFRAPQAFSLGANDVIVLFSIIYAYANGSVAARRHPPLQHSTAHRPLNSLPSPPLISRATEANCTLALFPMFSHPVHVVALMGECKSLVRCSLPAFDRWRAAVRIPVA